MSEEMNDPEVQWQILLIALPYQPETEVRPGKWDFADLLDLAGDWSLNDDSIVFDSMDEALVELERRQHAISMGRGLSVTEAEAETLRRVLTEDVRQQTAWLKARHTTKDEAIQAMHHREQSEALLERLA